MKTHAGPLLVIKSSPEACGCGIPGTDAAILCAVTEHPTSLCVVKYDDWFHSLAMNVSHRLMCSNMWSPAVIDFSRSYRTFGTWSRATKFGVKVSVPPGRVLLFWFWVYSHHERIHCHGAAA